MELFIENISKNFIRPAEPADEMVLLYLRIMDSRACKLEHYWSVSEARKALSLIHGLSAKRAEMKSLCDKMLKSDKLRGLVLEAIENDDNDKAVLARKIAKRIKNVVVSP
jgi:hypothetical protein